MLFVIVFFFQNPFPLYTYVTFVCHVQTQNFGLEKKKVKTTRRKLITTQNKTTHPPDAATLYVYMSISADNTAGVVERPTQRVAVFVDVEVRVLVLIKNCVAQKEMKVLASSDVSHTFCACTH